MRAEAAGEEVVLGHLRAIKEKSEDLSADFAEIKARLDFLVAGFGGLGEQAGSIGSRLDRLDARLDRIERRLELRKV